MTEERPSTDREATNTDSSTQRTQHVNEIQSTWPTFETPSAAVVAAVAAATNVDPLDLTTPLYDTLDPDALNALMSATDTSSGTEVRVSFEYEDVRVLLESNGALTVSVDSKGNE